MNTLCKQQQKYYNQLIDIVSNSGNFRASTLLWGNLGTGKRTIAKKVAEYLEFDFVEVRLDGPSQQVREQLFGTREQAERASKDFKAPGDAGRSTSTLLYLAGIA